MPISANEDIFGFEISIDDSRSMEAFTAFDDLSGIKPCTIAT